MKRTISIIASAALAISGSTVFATVSSAAPTVGHSGVAACMAAVASADAGGATLSLGDCIAFVATGGVDANGVCNSIGVPAPDFGKCVAAVNAILH